jgi:hypothetical protein
MDYLARQKLNFVIHLDNRDLFFNNVPLLFREGFDQNVFAQMNNKTVRETLSSPKYTKFSQQIVRNYSSSLEKPLGEFLFQLKNEGNPLYKKFLNPHGDTRYCAFSINYPGIFNAKGLYMYLVDGQVNYIGRCLDNFSKRINQGYGKIHPKNCYIDGQSTNCHMNSLIAKNIDLVLLFVCTLNDVKEIEYLEKLLIKKIQPEWNVIVKFE